MINNNNTDNNNNNDNNDNDNSDNIDKIILIIMMIIIIIMKIKIIISGFPKTWKYWLDVQRAIVSFHGERDHL